MKTHKFIQKISLPIVATLLLTLVSCNKFLDVKPSKNSNVEVETIEQLDAIMAEYSSFMNESSYVVMCGTDDFAFITDLHDAGIRVYGSDNRDFSFAGCWDYDNLANAIRDGLWKTSTASHSEWGKIFKANMVLHYLDKVSGNESDKDRLRAEAHFVRAYSYWALANTYCLPYTEAYKNEMGLPIRTGTDFEESLERVSLERTYQFIEEDIREALKCKTPLAQAGAWRANTAAVNGFVARYYLNRNNYTEALKYANNVLDEYNVVMDYNTDEMRRGTSWGYWEANGVEIKYPFTFSDLTTRQILDWKDWVYARQGNVAFYPSFFIPSQELLNLYDADYDLRFRYLMVQSYSYAQGIPGFNYPGYIFFYGGNPTGPGTPEMYLIKAECQARLGDYNAGMATLNQLRAKRFEPGPWVDLTATSKDDAIKKILEERRREMPFVQRWYDMRRLNHNEDPNDDVGDITRTFYRMDATGILSNQPPITYTLPKNSRKYAAPIPTAEIDASRGQLKQNIY
jgi:hypothetical protein